MVGRLVLIASVAGILAGCTNPGAAYREDAAHTFKTNLVAETERVLAEAGGVMTLSNALELAHTRSLKLAQQDLETKLARINRATLFSAFLPTVGLSGNGLIAGGRVDDMPNLGDLKDNNLRVRSASLLVAQPFVILFTIPFSYLGIFAAIVAARQTLSIFGLLAGIMLVGVVVNAAILIIDAWRQTGDVKAAAT